MSAPRDESAERQALVRQIARFTVQGGPSALQPCCTKPEHLTREHAVPQRPDLTVRICRRCGRRHFTLHADSATIVRP